MGQLENRSRHATSQLAEIGMDRRTVLTGSLATAGIIALPWTAKAGLPSMDHAGLSAGEKARKSATLGKYLCDAVHEKIATELDAKIADPSVDGEQTALALMEARCPGCGERVHPATSRISAVIPKWRSSHKKPTQLV